MESNQDNIYQIKLEHFCRMFFGQCTVFAQSHNLTICTDLCELMKTFLIQQSDKVVVGQCAVVGHQVSFCYFVFNNPHIFFSNQVGASL
jgi:hypothetical protein